MLVLQLTSGEVLQYGYKHHQLKEDLWQTVINLDLINSNNII